MPKFLSIKLSASWILKFLKYKVSRNKSLIAFIFFWIRIAYIKPQSYNDFSTRFLQRAYSYGHGKDDHELNCLQKDNGDKKLEGLVSLLLPISNFNVEKWRRNTG
jgi:hypothetical protein